MTTTLLPRSGRSSSGRSSPSGPRQSDLPPDLWRRFRRCPTVGLRNQIIEAYLPLLRTIAAGVKKGLPHQVELDDLVSAGCFGLIHAIHKYNPSRGVLFSTFCSRRVRGSIIDGLRRMDLPTRQMREREALVARVCDSFRKEFGHPPADEEVLPRLNSDPDKARRILADGRIARISSLSEPGTGARPVGDSIADRKRPSASSRATQRDLRDFALARLSRTERLILILYYTECMTMREAGKALGISESRVSQILSLVLRKLRDRAARERAPEP